MYTRTRLFSTLTRSLHFAGWLLMLFILPTGPAQAQVEVHATGLLSPIGIVADASGNLWVAEQGTGADDGRVSVITPDGTVYPFLAGLPSTGMNGELAGVNTLHFDLNGDLLLLQGIGTSPYSSKLFRIDPSGFTLGDTPLGLEDLTLVSDIGSFVLGAGFAESNPYSLALAPNDDFIVSDAGANALIRIDRDDGSLSVFAQFDPVPNPLFPSFGPPTSEAVPTTILMKDDHFLVGSLPGFPFATGSGRILKVDLMGNVSVLKDGLTTVVGLTLGPGGAPVFTQVYEFSPPPPPVGPLPNSGGVFKLSDSDSTVLPLATSLMLPSALAFDGDKTLFITTLIGDVLKLTFEADPPACAIDGIHEGPPMRLEVVVQDAGSGLASVEVVTAKNADVRWDDFAPGATEPLLVTATKQDQSRRSTVVLRVTDVHGNAVTCDPVITTLEGEQPDAFTLAQNYPNPFNPTTTIRFTIAEASAVRLVIYDVMGRRVATLVDEQIGAGTYEVEWDGRNDAGEPVAGGVYLYRLQAGDLTQMRQMMLLK